jgi:hypothetical protein
MDGRIEGMIAGNLMKRIAVASAAWALVVACNGSSGGAPASGVSAAQACADNAHQRCLQLQSCSATDLQLRYGDEGTCETRETYSCTTALQEPLSGNTPDAVEACANAYAGWACADYLADENVPAACQQQLGPVIDGGPCAIDGQCQTGFCAVAPGSACGACAAVPSAGDSCAQLTSCGPALACTADTFVCVVFGVRGDPCGKGAVCGVGLSCVGANPATNVKGTCQLAGDATGAVCDPAEKTHPGCDRDDALVCNSMSKTCQPVVVAPAGQPCGTVSDQPAYCQAEGFCTGATDTMPGTCTAAAADGAACDRATGPGCVIPARCIGNGNGTAGTCQYSGDQSCGG